MDPKEEKAPAPSSEPAKPGGVEQLKAPKMEKAPAPSSNPYRWENLSWEQKEVSINRVLLAKANYDKLLAEVPEYKLRTPSILSDSLGSTRKSPLFSSMDKEYPQLLPQIHVMPRRRDTSSVTVRATYKDDTVQFQLPLTSGIVDLKGKVAMRLALELDSFELKYKEYDGELISIACDEGLRSLVQRFSLLAYPIIRLFVVEQTVCVCV